MRRTTPAAGPPAVSSTFALQAAPLSEVLDRLLTTGIALRATAEIAVAGVDLVHLDLAALLVSSATLRLPVGSRRPGRSRRVR